MTRSVGASLTVFVGGTTLAALLAPAGLSLADWKAMAARGEIASPTYAYPRIAKWRRKDVMRFLANRRPPTNIQHNENQTVD